MTIAVQPITIASFISFWLYEKEFSIMGLNFPIGILSPNDLSRPDLTQPTPTDGVVPLSEIGKVSFSLMSYTFFV